MKRVLFGQLIVLWRDGLARASRSGQVSSGAAADEGGRSERTLHLRASPSRSKEKELVRNDLKSSKDGKMLTGHTTCRGGLGHISQQLAGGRGGAKGTDWA